MHGETTSSIVLVVLSVGFPERGAVSARWSVNETVQILMATYNGAPYVARQIESIMIQDLQDWSLLVSDDSSRDDTVEVVERYASADARMRLLDGGTHGGARNNFLYLLSQATAPYVAFSDQDDVWLPDKLASEFREMRRLEGLYGVDVPLLVFSDLAVVDEGLEIIAPSFLAYSGLDPQRTSLANLLAQNVAPGCVILANRALYREALRIPTDVSAVSMHDWWLMLTAAALGHIGFVKSPTMLYRQHGDNEVGAVSGSARDIVRNIGAYARKLLPNERQLEGIDIRVRQARAFLETYDDVLSQEDRILCEGFASLLDKAPAERVRWCHEHDALNASPAMRLGMDWELCLYDVARNHISQPQCKDDMDRGKESPSEEGGLCEKQRSENVGQAGPISVAVVMSTYNGERFIAQQVDSVLAQDMPGVRLFVRDDGSSDGTVDILREYESRGLLTLHVGENKGVVGSFLDALSMPGEQYAYLAFCDQDDVWHADKISRAVRLLEQRDQSLPQLYCSEYDFCDEDGAFVERSQLNRIGVGFRQLLVESVCSGNTMVMNRVLADELLANGTTGVYTHDWWAALLAAGLGELTFDEFDSLDYRRLSSSVSPTGSHGLSLLLFRLRTFLGQGQLQDIMDQLRHFREAYSDRLDAEDLATLDLMLNGGRLQKAAFPARLRQKLPEEVAVRLLFLVGLL